MGLTGTVDGKPVTIAILNHPSSTNYPTYWHARGYGLFAANPIGDFIDRHPTVKMLALSFIIMVGVALVADGLDFHIDRKFLYFAMAFSAGVESLNILAARKRRRS